VSSAARLQKLPRCWPVPPFSRECERVRARKKAMARYQNIIIILLKIQRIIDIPWTTNGKIGKNTMPFTKVDQKGRMMLPSEIRRKMGISPGDEFVVDELGPDTILLKKVDVRAMIRDAIKRARDVDLDKLEAEMTEEGNRVARKMYKILD